MPIPIAAPISASNSNGCAATSRARPWATKRLRRTPAGEVVLQLKTPYRDGTTHLVMTPLEFLQRLAVLIPRPRLHLIRFHGILAPNATLRSQIVPGDQDQASAASNETGALAPAPTRARMSWAQ